MAQPVLKRLEFWPSLISLAAFILCMTLGFWQVQRLQWKQGLIQMLDERLAASAVVLSEKPDVDLMHDEFLKVSFSGTFDFSKEMLFGQYFNGTWGYQLYTPMALDAGGVVFVNRGWIPGEMREHSRRPESVAEPHAMLTGIIRKPTQPRFFTPDNDTVKNYWFWADLPAMEAYAGVKAKPYLLEVMDHHTPGGWPLTPKKDYKLRNDHLMYALTWFSLAAAVLVICAVYHRNRWREQHG